MARVFRLWVDSPGQFGFDEHLKMPRLHAIDPIEPGTEALGNVLDLDSSQERLAVIVTWHGEPDDRQGG
ncbi:hypothetical protein D3C84_1202160 [compost metagenome]